MTADSIINAARWGRFVAMWRDIGKAHALPFTVLLWSVDPDVDGNDPDMGADFATLEEAVACYRETVMHPADGGLAKNYRGVWAYVMIDGPGVHEVTAQPDRRALKRYRREMAIDDAAAEREHAMQAGMAFGCDGYNDAMGW